MLRAPPRLTLPDTLFPYTTPFRSGNIWFYNAGGRLIGDGATFNVGSLLLTTNAIDTTGGLFGPGGAIRFRGAASTPTTAPTIEIASNAAINATIPGNPGASYVAVVAPRIVQRGIVTADGATAYVAAEQRSEGRRVGTGGAVRVDIGGGRFTKK